MNDPHHYESNCPQCNYFMDASTSIDGDENVKPSPGDISLCIKCGAMLDFDDDMKLQFLRQEKFEELDDETRSQILSARAVIKRIKK